MLFEITSFFRFGFGDFLRNPLAIGIGRMKSEAWDRCRG